MLHNLVGALVDGGKLCLDLLFSHGFDGWLGGCWLGFLGLGSLGGLMGGFGGCYGRLCRRQLGTDLDEVLQGESWAKAA